MPILIKQRTEHSPGIIVFNHNEALTGLPKKSQKIKNLLINLNQSKKWIFGVHMQGHLDYIGFWKKEKWQNFFMWPNSKSNFLKKIPKNIITEITCINFYKKKILGFNKNKKYYDLISILRFSSIKRMKLNLMILKELLELNPNLKILFIAPIESSITFSNKNNENDELFWVKNFIKDNLSSSQRKNINFICVPKLIFGNRPLSEELLYELIASSKNLLFCSLKEGMPRAIIESLLLNTNIIVSKNLKCGIPKLLTGPGVFKFNEKKFFFDDIENAIYIARQINKFLKKKIKKPLLKKKEIFLENKNKKLLQFFLKSVAANNQMKIGDNKGWHLHDLNYRLAMHGENYNLTFFNNENAFLNWFDKVNNSKIKNFNEENLYQDSLVLDKKKFYFNQVFYYINSYYIKIRNKLIKFVT